MHLVLSILWVIKENEEITNDMKIKSYCMFAMRQTSKWSACKHLKATGRPLAMRTIKTISSNIKKNLHLIKITALLVTNKYTKREVWQT